jgi:DNA-binding SARP family transcriptional activator
VRDGAGQGRFRLLGRVRLETAAGEVDLGSTKQRCLLAVLLLAAGEVVPVDTLVDRIWGDQPPGQARNSLASYVARLRRIVTLDGPALAAFRYEGGGYRAECDPDRVDLLRARRAAAAARAATDPERAAALFAAALDGWQADALGGINGDWADRVRGALRRERLALIGERLDAELRLGRDAEVIAELGQLLVEHPTAEELAGRLVRALARAGRTMEALGAYARLRAAVADELGVEPSAPLQELHLRVLRDDPALTEPEPGPGPAAAPPPAPPVPAPVPAPPVPAPPAPAQLPADAAYFTGRDADLGRLDELLGAGAAPVAVITAAAGVGKTALAVHWAHRERHRFPDGQLFVNLNGYAPGPPSRPLDVLGGVLPALGVPPEQVPTDLDQAAALYRSLLADRRMLVVLDNARDPGQVRPLLPGTPGCLTLVTSRNRMSGLAARDGAVRLTLRVLGPDAARALLMRVLGADRVDAEPAAAAALARACGHLPLALRITAAQLLDQPGRTLAEQLAGLEGDRLAELSIEGDPQTAVRAAFDLSYATLPADVRRLFRLLALAPGPDLTLPAAQAAGGLPAGDTAVLLDRLAAAHLVDTPSPGRWAYHDLIRLYAADRAVATDPERERAAAVDRLLAWYLYRTDTAAGQLYPELLRLPVPAPPPGLPPTGSADPAEALAWLLAEKDNLVEGVRYAAGRPAPVAWLLADALRGFFWRTCGRVHLLVVADLGLRAATAAGDLAGQAAMHNSLGVIAKRELRYDDALEHYQATVALARQAGWRAGEAAGYGNLGAAYSAMDDLDREAEVRTKAIALYREVGDRAGLALALANHGGQHTHRGDLPAAADLLGEALALHEALGTAAGAAHAAVNLAEVERLRGQLEAARGHAGYALARWRELGDRYSESSSLGVLARVECDAGRADAALAAATEGLRLAERMGEAEDRVFAHTVLGEVNARAGAAGAARRQFRLAVAAGDGYRYLRADALVGLAGVAADPAEADRLLTEAEAITGPAGYRITAAAALAVRAGLALAAGDPGTAAELAGRALSADRDCGARLAEAGVRVLLGRIAAAGGRPAEAAACWRAAREIRAGAGADVSEVDSLLRPGAAPAAG